MCTVSFYNSGSNVFITSNRDEHISRPNALAPQKYHYKGSTLFFPKDPQAGGTWFAVRDDANVFVLLNGADKKHHHSPPYRMSRGIILLEIANSASLENSWNEMELVNIEPFTVVAYSEKKLFQLRWNGFSKSQFEFDSKLPRIWSSATLYEPDVIKARENWFAEFITAKDVQINSDSLLSFHSTTNIHDSKNGLIINRDNGVLTKNVTQFVLENNQFKFLHRDLIENSNTEFIEHF